MAENLGKLAQDIENLVNGFLSKAQMPGAAPAPMGERPSQEYGENALKMLQNAFSTKIKNDAMVILQSLMDAIWNKEQAKCDEEYRRSGDREKGIDQKECPHEEFGYFEIDARIAVKNGNVVLGFVLSPTLGTNKAKNQLFAKQLNAKLPRKYNRPMTAAVKKMEGGNEVTFNARLTQLAP